MAKRGRPSKEAKIVKSFEPKTPIASAGMGNLYLPNHSGLAKHRDFNNNTFWRDDGNDNIIYKTTTKDGILRVKLENSSAAAANVVGSTYQLIGDMSYASVGMTNSGSTILAGDWANTMHIYNQGYGDTRLVVDGNKAFRFYSDPGDNHDYTALSNEILRLDADGTITCTNQIKSVTDPTDNQDAATKKYVDDNDYWTRSGTTLSPKTAGDDVDLGDGEIYADFGVFGSEATTANSYNSAIKLAHVMPSGGGGGLNAACWLAPAANPAANSTNTFCSVGGYTVSQNDNVDGKQIGLLFGNYQTLGTTNNPNGIRKGIEAWGLGGYAPTATVKDVYGLHCQAVSRGTVGFGTAGGNFTATNTYGIKVEADDGSGTGTITNEYTCWIGEPDTATNKYQLYLDASSSNGLWMNNNAGDLDLHCPTDKTLELQETVWDDINAGSQTISLLGLFTGPSATDLLDNTGTGTGISAYGFGVGEAFSNAFEIEHKYKEGSNLKFHVHWVGQNSAPTGTDKVKWQLTYCICKTGSTTPAPTTITIEADIDTRYEWMTTTFADIAGTNVEIGDQFMFTLERVSASANEYASDAVVATVGIHHEVDTMGSRQVTSK